MRVSTSSDPRLEAMLGAGNFSDAGARPVVAVRRDRVPMWVIAVIASVAAILLFWVLESRRSANGQQKTVASGQAFPEAPPPLIVPPQYADNRFTADPDASPQFSRPAPVVLSSTPVTVQSYRPANSRSMQPSALPFPPNNPLQGSPALVIDSGRAPVGPSTPTGALNDSARGPLQMAPPPERTHATKLANPAFTIAQGVLIPAVLETAFYSTPAGYARAIVSRDVRSFDGTKVLIPRGSRLIGEYRGTVGPGENRAMINWTRLIRGDGVTISLSSPAVDPQGRSGIRAGVNMHLLERITDSLLQSTVGLAGSFLRSSRNSVIVAVPGGAATDALPDGAPSGTPPRSLSVPAGTSISVFVARDLEFQADMGQP